MRARQMPCLLKPVNHFAAGIGGGAVDGRDADAEQTQVDHELAAMMRGMVQAAQENPGARTRHVEERRRLAPPAPRLCAQNGEAPGSVSGVLRDVTGLCFLVGL